MNMPFTTIQRSKLILALLAQDIVDLINEILSSHQAALILDYTNRDHCPRVLIEAPGKDSSTWFIANTRKRISQQVEPENTDLRWIALGINTGLDMMGARLSLVADKPPGKKATARLQVHVDGARLMALTLATFTDGQVIREINFKVPG